MAVFLRLLLAICLVATALPAPLAHAAADAASTAVVADADSGGPPCHPVDAPAAAPDAPAPPDPHGCCGDGCTCDGGCGCLHAAGLPTALPPAAAAVVPEGPALAAMRSATPPRLTPPVRPPIA